MQSKIPKLISVIFVSVMAAFFTSCGDDDRPVFPLTDASTVLFHSVDGKQVAFTALTHSAASWTWDFGDGTTSAEQNPVHVYKEGGYYKATLTASDDHGTLVTKTVKLALDLPPYALLTGDHTAEGYKGKTWKLTTAHTAGGDYLANANATFTTVSGTPKPLPDGIFKSEFGMGDVYEDTYTFLHDGSYKHDVKADGAAFGGMVYQIAKGWTANIVNKNGQSYGLCIAKYTPEANATFSFKENVTFAASSVYAAGGAMSFNNVMTLDFSGTEFIGFRDFQRNVMVRSISDTRMQVVMFMAAGSSPSQIGINTHALILSFEVVK